MINIPKVSFLSIALLALALAQSSYAGEFKIKQFEIGMPLEGYQEQAHCRPQVSGDVICVNLHPSITIGGERIKTMSITFEKGETASVILFTFASDDYSSIRQAVTGKHKKIKCKTGQVSNAMGATFATEECMAIGAIDGLVMKKYDGSITEGTITLVSNKAVARSIRESKEKAGDI